MSSLWNRINPFQLMAHQPERRTVAEILCSIEARMQALELKIGALMSGVDDLNASEKNLTDAVTAVIAYLKQPVQAGLTDAQAEALSVSNNALAASLTAAMTPAAA